MDAYRTARLAAKDAESAIVARICEEFKLTPVLARAHDEQMARYFADYGQVAVPSVEPAGKPIVAWRKVQVARTVQVPRPHSPGRDRRNSLNFPLRGEMAPGPVP